MSNGTANPSKNGSTHPFVKKDPKPTRARLVSLLGPLGRKRYAEVERYLATINGASSGLYYYGSKCGWAVRYQLGVKTTLCILHLLPDNFEATVALGKELDEPLKKQTLCPDLKRRLSRTKIENGTRALRLPIKNDADYASFKAVIDLKAEALQAKKALKAAAKAPAAAKKAAVAS